MSDVRHLIKKVVPMPIYRQGGFREVETTKGGSLKVTRVIVGRRPR